MNLITYLQEMLEQNIADISTPLVMAKTAYAFILWDPSGETTQEAISRLHRLSRTTRDGNSMCSLVRVFCFCGWTTIWSHCFYDLTIMYVVTLVFVV